MPSCRHPGGHCTIWRRPALALSAALEYPSEALAQRLLGPPHPDGWTSVPASHWLHRSSIAPQCSPARAPRSQYRGTTAACAISVDSGPVRPSPAICFSSLKPASSRQRALIQCPALWPSRQRHRTVPPRAVCEYRRPAPILRPRAERGAYFLSALPSSDSCSPK